jgi:hypothetical protein
MKRWAWIVAFCACTSSTPDSPKPADAGGDLPATVTPDSRAVGEKVALLSNQKGLKDLAVDETGVYWTSTDGDGAVGRVPLAGGSATVLSTGHQGWSLAVNRRSIYIAASDAEPIWDAMKFFALLEVPMGGGTATAFLPRAGNPVPDILSWSGTDLLVDDTDLYFVGRKGLTGLSLAHPVLEALAGSVVNRGVAMNATEVFFAGCRGAGGAPAVVEVNKKTHAVTMTTSECVAALDEADGVIYWLSQGGDLSKGWLRSARLNGAPKALGASTMIADVPGNLSRIAVIPPHAYISTREGTLVRVALADGAVTTLEGGMVHPRARLARDPNSLYWITSDESAIWRMRVK